MLPPHEPLPAHCFQLGGQHYLATGNRASELAALGQGGFSPVVIRYAFPRLGTFRPFFPTVAVDDWGKLYRGLEAVDWISTQGLLYPRADAEGQWPDGETDQLFNKELDLGTAMLAYASPTESDFPGVRLMTAIELVADTTFALAPGGNFPARLLSAIPAIQLNAALPFSETVPLIPQVIATPRVIPIDD